MLWGTTGTAQALAPVGATPLAVGTLRLAVGRRRWCSSRGCGARCTSGIGAIRPPCWRPRAWRGTKASFFGGVARTGVAVGTLVAIGSAPVIAGIVETFLSGRRPAPRWWAATGTAITSARPCFWPRRGWNADAAGVLLAVTAVASFAVYTVASKSLLQR